MLSLPKHLQSLGFAKNVSSLSADAAQTLRQAQRL